jgi:hypothetical protein
MSVVVKSSIMNAFISTKNGGRYNVNHGLTDLTACYGPDSHSSKLTLALALALALAPAPCKLAGESRNVTRASTPAGDLPKLTQGRVNRLACPLSKWRKGECKNGESPK